MDRISCNACKQCNHKGKPSVLRLSKYCDNNYVHRIKTKKSIFGFLTNIKEKLYDKRAEYDEEGKLKKVNTDGFRKTWFWR